MQELTKDQQISHLKHQLYILSSKFRQCPKHDEDPTFTKLYLETKVECHDCAADKLVAKKETNNEPAIQK